jgi:predicted Zn-dependent protease
MKLRAFAANAASCTLLVFGAGFAAADNLPDLGDASALDVPPALERQVGEAQMNEIRLRESRFLDDPELATYLRRIADRLVAANDTANLEVRLFALDDPSINAFAMFGGYIGVNTGLITSAHSESEVAGVLAHEIAHVSQRHLARQVSAQKQVALGSMLAIAVAIFAARSNPDVANAAIAGSQAAGIQAQLGFTRDHEREADRIGFDMMQRSGLDSRAMVSFFHRLQRAGRVYENNAPAYLRTHPLTLERITDLEHRVAQAAPYAQRGDGAGEFRLIQARLLAQGGQPDDALVAARDRFERAGKEAEDRAVAAYGLAVALLRARQADEAEQVLAGADSRSPLVQRLSAEIAAARGDRALAIHRYRKALAQHEDRPALWYGLSEMLLADRQFEAARELLDHRLRKAGDDPESYARLARAYEGLGRVASRHRAQAEAYQLRGQTLAAIEQLELAQRAGTPDFVEQSMIDARLRELKRRQSDLAPERRQ